MPASSAPDPLLRPPALRPGDTIGIVAPAKSVEEPTLDRIRKRLDLLGYRMKAAANVTTRWGYLAGTDDDRAAGVMAMQRDPEVDAVFCVAGGYGCTRILDLLDYDAFRDRPKIVIGYSDITGLHAALQGVAGIVSFHAPMPMTFLSWTDSPPPEPAWTAFWEILRGERGAGWILRSGDSGTDPWRAIVGGSARGMLVGGNLSLVCALMGTPYEVRTAGRILFIEDVGEEPYRIDRYLSQLRLAGRLDQVAGVILGAWTGCEPEDPERSLALIEVLDGYFAGLQTPVVAGFPAGHQALNITLPLGLEVELNADEGWLRYTSAPVIVGPAR